MFGGHNTKLTDCFIHGRYFYSEKEMYRYIYGPVPSWRLGSSLGIDLLSCEDKLCSFDCIYCQIGKTLNLTVERGLFVPTEAVIEELKMLPEACQIDYITFSGRGEPTLAVNLGEVIKAVKALRREPVAVFTNSSLMHREEVRSALSLTDLVAVKLDGVSQRLLELINRPPQDIRFEKILNSLKEFRRGYTGHLALQIMFIDENKEDAGLLAELCDQILPDVVQINTPLRLSEIPPLSKEEILRIKGYFKGMRVVSVYDGEPREVSPMSIEDTLKRRGRTTTRKVGE